MSKSSYRGRERQQELFGAVELKQPGPVKKDEPASRDIEAGKMSQRCVNDESQTASGGCTYQKRLTGTRKGVDCTEHKTRVSHRVSHRVRRQE